MDEQERRIREIKNSVDHVNDLVQWSTEVIRDTIVESSKPKASPLDSIVDYIKPSSESIKNVEIDLKYYFDRQNEQITAILRNSSIVVDTVKTAVKNDRANDNLQSSISRRTELVTSKPVVETVGRAQVNTGMNPDMQKKLENVLDSAAGFFNSWGNPVEVGAALTLPIVGALGIAFGGVVLSINKLVDGITSITGQISNIPSSLIGALGSAMSGSSSSSSGNAAVDTNALNSSILSGTKPILDQLTNIDGSIRNLKIENASFSVNFDPVIRAIESATASFTSAISSNPVRDVQNTTISVPDAEDDIAFKSRVITLLENPVPVEVILRDRQSLSDNVSREEVFADAVRPLVRNQEAMYNMLSSNLRELNQAIATLRVPPEVGREDRITKLNDSVNMTVNEGAVEMILEETRIIAQAIAGFRSDFGAFSTTWTAANSEKKKERSEDETVLSGD